MHKKKSAEVCAKACSTGEKVRMNSSSKANLHPRGVASSETAREINRDVLLHSVHRHQPISRADLARLSGLQPSTVSVIVGQLIEEGWVVSGEQGHLPRGRRPTYVMLNDRHVTLAIDLRPDKANLAMVDINGQIVTRETVPLSAREHADEDLRNVLQKIAQAARTLRAMSVDYCFDGVGVSVSGRVAPETHRLMFSPNAPWIQADLYTELEKALGVPVEMENAANACLYGERWFGKLGQTANVLTVSIADGIGTALLVDGRLLRGRDGMAGEFGHMTLEESGPPCGCGNRGCWEVFASNHAALRYYREFVPESQIDTFQDLLDLAKSGDLYALRAIDRMMHYLGRGLTILCAGLAPEKILIVGDCTALWPRIQPLLESQLIAKAIRPNTPQLMAATDGGTARLRGAAALVFHKLLFRHTELGQPLTLVDERAEAVSSAWN
jgi:predicted NBD/HSP70 family sugar kinase